MITFILNGSETSTESEGSLLDFLRSRHLTAAKNACGEGACGACSVLIEGKAIASCMVSLEKVQGKKVTTAEGIEEAEMALYVESFAKAGAVQCGYCTPGMVIAAKALLDANPSPDEAAVRAGIKRNICRCTGYAKIVAGILLAAAARRGEPAQPIPEAASGGIGRRMTRIDAALKASGKAVYVDDIAEPEGMLYGAALRTSHPRARLLRVDISAALALPGVVTVATAKDIPGQRIIGKLKADWPTLIEVGEETRYVGDTIALVAAQSRAIAKKAISLIKADYEILEPLRNPKAALAPGAPLLHPEGNLLSSLRLKRGNADAALMEAPHVISLSFNTPFTDHAFMECESALAWPPDAQGVLLVYTGGQNVFDDRKYIAHTLGLEEEKVRVVSSFVGGGFGGKEDQAVQHHAALLAYLSGHPVKCSLGRAESSRVHVKRHAMEIDMTLACDANGKIMGMKGKVVADTGAYASLGGPVLHRAVTHLGGPYSYENIDVEGLAVYTNNPPAGAFRGFGVPQVNFAIESAMNAMAEKIGISPWEIRYRNAVRPGSVISNGQIAGPDTALEECLLAVKPVLDASGGRAGIACGFKNTGIGVGHPDIGRCILRFHADHAEVLSGAACIGQGLATILTQLACGTLGLHPERVSVAMPDTASTPNSGTTTASRQTLVTGEACRKACLDALAALGDAAGPSGSTPDSNYFPYASLAGRDFYAEYLAATDPFDSDKPNPVRHVAYSYACQLALLNDSGRLERIVAAHDSGLVVNPLSFEGQVEGGVAMGIGYALTENFPLADCVPTAKFGTLGLLRATDMPVIETIIVRKAGSGDAVDGGISGAAYGAKGIGEISTIPTASAIGGAYFLRDGRLRKRLPLEDTPYSKKES